MKRVVLIVFALLVLAPSAVRAAVQYRCATHGQVRSACCCPTKAKHHGGSSSDTKLRAACCCTLSEAKARETTPRTSPQAVFEVSPALVTVVIVVAPPIVDATPVAMLDYPQVQRGPPETLFARHCALLI